MTFAKIIDATDGAQVLFFKDNGDDGPELVAMTELDGATLRLGFGYDDTDSGLAKREAYFLSVDIDVADKIRATVRAMAGSDA